MARRPIPPCHYMIAAFGGGDVRCAGYANFGTAALSALALEALDGRNACLLANHGMVVFAPSLERAMWLATELETLARQYIASLALGGPVLLTAAEIAEAAASFGPYGLRPRS
jgi:L-fuculose-phosphate aldolase